MMIKALILLTILTVSCSDSKESYVKSLLPETATEIKEHYEDRGLSGDFIRLLKAKVTKEEFENYALKLKLTEKYSEYLKKDLNHKGFSRGANYPDWWDEPEDSIDFYFIKDLNKEFHRRLKWKNGWLYLATEAW